jgi:hypothetical protein
VTLADIYALATLVAVAIGSQVKVTKPLWLLRSLQQATLEKTELITWRF